MCGSTRSWELTSGLYRLKVSGQSGGQDVKSAEVATVGKCSAPNLAPSCNRACTRSC